MVIIQLLKDTKYPANYQIIIDSSLGNFAVQRDFFSALPVEGEEPAGDKFRVSGTQETVEGAGANEVSGVLSEASCCRCGAPLIKNHRASRCALERCLEGFATLDGHKSMPSRERRCSGGPWNGDCRVR